MVTEQPSNVQKQCIEAKKHLEKQAKMQCGGQKVLKGAHK